MRGEPTEIIYVRIPVAVAQEVRRRAKIEERSLAVMVSRLLRHALAVTVSRETED